ncbi:uncharacterized protein V1516DRAFT_681942 [Lipomyces oligophaga]|uniref:uncharacterized protein n=1 Tax=Lipomyces oligophaga TaxID=45792 RepID=UPI0034CD7DD5
METAMDSSTDNTDNDGLSIETPSPSPPSPQIQEDLKPPSEKAPLDSSDSTEDVAPITADDYDAMMRLVCPPMEDLEVAEETHHTWHIESWRKLEKRLHGPAFKTSCFEWRPLLFPAGNCADQVSLYLECSPIEKPADETDWAVCAQFGLVMANYRDPSAFHEFHAHHRFTHDDKDWGFTRFYELAKLNVKSNNQDSPLLEDDKVNIITYVRIIKDPTGVLWHNFTNYDSKKETGYVGLRNQGATCYMNSLLQSLFFTTQFRKTVYQIPTDTDEPTSSVPLALQRVFYQLQTAQHPVGTLVLTRSFGWDTADAFTQHDVQEFLRVLMDNLEGKMKGTKVDKALNELFVGQMKSYVKCINVDFESSRTEDFWDIQLNVKGMKNLHDAFKDYIQVETLNGENQYMATGHGLQDAEKGVIFQSFPPILHLQLKRFDYDFIRDMMVKINDRYEFPLEIDLKEFLTPETSRDEPWEYVLHGVLVHSGDLNAGHYYALLKPDKEGDWYKFDDDRVTKATLKEVLDENYGEDLQPNTQQVNSGFMGQYAAMRQQPKFSVRRHSNAYMLVYLRKSRLDTILAPLAAEDTPLHIAARIEQEQRDEEARRKEREEQHLYMTVKVMSNRNFVHYHGFDIAQWTDDAAGSDVPVEARPLLLKVLRKFRVSELRDLVAKELNIARPQTLRFWIITNRQNKTLRPDSVLPDDPILTLEEIKERQGSKGTDLKLYVEQAQYNSANRTIVPFQADGIGEHSKRFLIFIKYFDVREQTLTGVGCVVLGKDDKLSDMVVQINELMGWPSHTNLLLYEEVTSTMVEFLKIKQSIAQAEIQDGDVICFQKRFSDSELSKIPGYHDVKSYYDYLRNRVQLVFKPRPSDDEELKEFQLYLSLNDTYTQLSTKVGAYLGVDPTHLRFTSTQLSGTVRNVIRANTTATLKDMIMPGYSQLISPLMFYEVLDVSLQELESKRPVKIMLLTEGIVQGHMYDLLVPKTGYVRDIINELVTKAELPVEYAEKMRVYGVQVNRIHRQYPEDRAVQSILESAALYAEVTGPDDTKNNDDERLISVFHYQKDVSHTHGVPFFFTLKAGEPFSETKKRLQKRMGMSEKQFERIKFALIQRGQNAKPFELENDDDKILYDMAERDDELGLDHLDKTTYRGLRHEQRAIFIKK